VNNTLSCWPRGKPTQHKLGAVPPPTQSIALELDFAEVERRVFGQPEYDLYVQEASRMFNCPPENVTADQRNQAKISLHRAIYHHKG